jgi:hypothetical protein
MPSRFHLPWHSSCTCVPRAIYSKIMTRENSRRSFFFFFTVSNLQDMRMNGCWNRVSRRAYEVLQLRTRRVLGLERRWIWA